MQDRSDVWYSTRAGEARGRVLLVIRLLAGRRGGAERVYAELADVLRSAGYDVTCVHCDSSDEAPGYALPPEVPVINLYRRANRRGAVNRLLRFMARPYPRVAVLAPLAWLSRNSAFIRALADSIRETRPDALISFLPSANTPSLIAGRLCGVKVVITNHGAPEHDYASQTRWDQNPVDRWLRFRVLWLADRIQVLSPSFAEWFPPSLQQRVVSIPNCLAGEFEASTAPLTHSHPSHERALIAVGRLVPEKGYAQLIDAFHSLAERFPDWSLRIYGEGPERPRLAAQIQRCGLGERVRLMGQTKEIRQVYLAGDIFCHPAAHEGFGLAMLEALACGLPVVAFSECQAAGELVQHAHNGLLASQAAGPAALADALGLLMSDPGLRERLAAMAPSSVTRFNRETFAASWCAVVDALCEHQPTKQPPARLVA